MLWQELWDQVVAEAARHVNLLLAVVNCTFYLFLFSLDRRRKRMRSGEGWGGRGEERILSNSMLSGKPTVESTLELDLRILRL